MKKCALTNPFFTCRVGNTGSFNKGNVNLGNFNDASANNGNFNKGNANAGSFNTGSQNNGNSNTGNQNDGSGNSGNQNTVRLPWLLWTLKSYKQSTVQVLFEFSPVFGNPD